MIGAPLLLMKTLVRVNESKKSFPTASSGSESEKSFLDLFKKIRNPLEYINCIACISFKTYFVPWDIIQTCSNFYLYVLFCQLQKMLSFYFIFLFVFLQFFDRNMSQKLTVLIKDKYVMLKILNRISMFITMEMINFNFSFFFIV